ncbi:hypothetical protein Pth03_03110 [Planotetraspora thailandica]|uniref:Activator of Hsp90 ATPase homologue 1/2-like C-terminal domain-containing protein n=1 Tax=Planotetraspora thailandica TaxID=487172 RepID=A0A8J3XRE0_9ACTN|nr:SRPBCC domain-containing protein [Planotetraspora thailandica]GII51922.1 hypothetical protein Pth03_03110 [Planotetraspora thailandica]
MGEEFELRKEVELDATPEQVWEAIATGPGIDAWFMGRNEVEPREGGTIRMTVAGETSESTVTAWEPMKRLAHSSATGDDGAFMAFEYLIEARDGGSTVLRLVQSGVLSGDWETEYDALTEGWDIYLHSIGQYLTHFRGRHATVVMAFKPQAAGRDHAWAVIKERLGLGAEVAVGDPVRLAVEGAPPVEGVVDYAGLPTFIGVRTGDGLYRFIHSGPKRGDVVVLGHHIFTDGPSPDGEEAQRAWQTWLDGLFGEPAAA